MNIQWFMPTILIVRLPLMRSKRQRLIPINRVPCFKITSASMMWKCTLDKLLTLKCLRKVMLFTSLPQELVEEKVIPCALFNHLLGDSHTLRMPTMDTPKCMSMLMKSNSDSLESIKRLMNYLNFIVSQFWLTNRERNLMSSCH